jgi:hypothetical protein
MPSPEEASGEQASPQQADPPGEKSDCRLSMGGLVAVIVGFASLAGLCAYLIDYGEGARRFPPDVARRRAARVGLTAAAFFTALGVLLVVLLLHG